MSTEVVLTKKQQMIVSSSFKESVASALPAGFKVDTFIARAKLAMVSNPKLEECSESSISKCILDSAMLGLELDGIHSYLIPYKTSCTLIPSYKGLRKIAMRSGLYKDIGTSIVCENDVFIEGKNNKVIEHRINRRKPRGRVFAVYAYAELMDGYFKYEIMGMDQVEKVRDGSNGSRNPVWKNNLEEMSRKTVLRRLFKYLEFGDESVDTMIKLQELENLEHQKVDLSYQPHIDEDPDKVYRELQDEMNQKGLTIEDLSNKLSGRLGHELTDLRQLDAGKAQQTLNWLVNAPKK